MLGEIIAVDRLSRRRRLATHVFVGSSEDTMGDRHFTGQSSVAVAVRGILL